MKKSEVYIYGIAMVAASLNNKLGNRAACSGIVAIARMILIPFLLKNSVVNSLSNLLLTSIIRVDLTTDR